MREIYRVGGGMVKVECPTCEMNILTYRGLLPHPSQG